MPVLIFLADNNCEFAAVAQRNVPDQRAAVFDVIAVAVCAQIVVHPVQQLQIVGRIPVIHLLADIRILIPGKRCLVIPVIGDQPDLFVYDLLFHAFRNSSFGTAPCSFLPISIRTSHRSGSALE